MSKRKRNSESLTQECVKNKKQDIPYKFLQLTDTLNYELNKLQFLNKLEYVYNPTIYARQSYKCYVEKYCDTTKKVMFLGMNPGPWGMSQTGVPFGEVTTVRDWLEIEESVHKPAKEHPLRPVLGFSCQKTEVSGKRFWTLIRELCGTPSNFFSDCFVYNYLPLQFIDSKGKNLPPTTLKKQEQEELFKVCDKTLLDTIDLYKVDIIVAIGKFAETRAKTALSFSRDLDHVKVVCILHPSPQSKAANNWHVDAHKQLQQLGILNYLLH